MDAKRTKDGLAVCFKAIFRSLKEAEIAKYYIFVTWVATRASTNHSVPILDIFREILASDFEYLVMLLLRPFDDPKFAVIGEVVDFVMQILEICRVPEVLLTSEFNCEQGLTLIAPQPQPLPEHVTWSNTSNIKHHLFSSTSPSDHDMSLAGETYM